MANIMIKKSSVSPQIHQTLCCYALVNPIKPKMKSQSQPLKKRWDFDSFYIEVNPKILDKYHWTSMSNWWSPRRKISTMSTDICSSTPRNWSHPEPPHNKCMVRMDSLTIWPYGTWQEDLKVQIFRQKYSWMLQSAIFNEGLEQKLSAGIANLRIVVLCFITSTVLARSLKHHLLGVTSNLKSSETGDATKSCSSQPPSPKYLRQLKLDSNQL